MRLVKKAIWITFLSATTGLIGHSLCAETKPFVCPITRPPVSGDRYGNAFLAADLGDDGIVVFKPGGTGFVLPDGALSIKWPWWRRVRGKLFIEGHRLDGTAPALRSRIPDGYGDIGFQATALIFPTPGCWEVTGRVADGQLTFVIQVIKIGKGPGHGHSANSLSGRNRIASRAPTNNSTMDPTNGTTQLPVTSTR
jgi:hypothetical protein